MVHKVLALDQSSSITGLAIGSSSDDPHGGYLFGSIRIPAKLTFGEKLAHLHLKLDAVIREHQPSQIVFESPFFPVAQQRFGKPQDSFVPAAGMLPAEQVGVAPAARGAVFSIEVAKALQKVAGTIECLAALHGIPCEDVASSTWRVVALGQGRAPKGAPQAWFKEAMKRRAVQLGYEVKDDNEADAIGILLFALTGQKAAARAQGDLMALVAKRL